MVRAHTLPHPRPAGFALLKPAAAPRLDPTRIVTLSGTLAVNLLALGLLMMPLTLPETLLAPAEEPTNPDVVLIKRIAVDVPVTPDPLPPPPQPTLQPPSLSRTAPTQAPVAPMQVASAVDLATDSAPVQESGPIGPVAPADSIAPPAAGPAPVQLRYRTAPAPVYPRSAMLDGISGTVLLRVVVGVDGRPIEVSVARSSGHRALDNAARAQVLRRWSFEPAMLDGRAVEAMGLVPIEFALRN
jgi:protein TonB